MHTPAFAQFVGHSLAELESYLESYESTPPDNSCDSVQTQLSRVREPRVHVYYDEHDLPPTTLSEKLGYRSNQVFMRSSDARPLINKPGLAWNASKQDDIRNDNLSVTTLIDFARLKRNQRLSDSILQNVASSQIKLESLLGQGTFGCVYEATIQGLKLAVKFVLDSSSTRESVLRESMICSRLRHKNLVRAFDLRQVGQYWLIVMELVPGKSLSSNRHSQRTGLQLVRQLASAILYLGKNGIVHRDIKPSNIIVRHIDDCPILVDFGIAIVTRIRKRMIPPRIERRCQR